MGRALGGFIWPSLEGVLRLLDARVGSDADVTSLRPGMLQVCAHGPRASRRFDITDLRVLVVADVLLRSAEMLGGLQVLILLAADVGPGQVEALVKAAGMISVHPPAAYVSPPGAETPFGGPADVHVARDDVSVGGTGLLVGVGPVRAGREDLLAGVGVAAPPEDDPLAVRLAMLSRAHQRPVDLTPAVLADAQETLRRWRRRVSEWAETPSRPMHPGAARAVSALEDDLGTSALLAELYDLENQASVPAGAKFETFAYFDRILGLDLVRDIGRPRA
jgi:hypothetical protein